MASFKVVLGALVMAVIGQAVGQIIPTGNAVVVTSDEKVFYTLPTPINHASLTEHGSDTAITTVTEYDPAYATVASFINTVYPLSLATTSTITCDPYCTTIYVVGWTTAGTLTDVTYEFTTTTLHHSSFTTSATNVSETVTMPGSTGTSAYGYQARDGKSSLSEPILTVASFPGLSFTLTSVSLLSSGLPSTASCYNNDGYVCIPSATSVFASVSSSINASGVSIMGGSTQSSAPFSVTTYNEDSSTPTFVTPTYTVPLTITFTNSAGSSTEMETGVGDQTVASAHTGVSVQSDTSVTSLESSEASTLSSFASYTSGHNVTVTVTFAGGSSAEMSATAASETGATETANGSGANTVAPSESSSEGNNAVAGFRATKETAELIAVGVAFAMVV